MRYLFGPRNVGVLQQFAWSHVLIGLDFDGTLAPIGLDVRTAMMRPATKRALERVAARYPTVVVSGRAKRDVARRLQGTGLRAVAGNHGMEPWEDADKFERAVARWLPLLRRSLGRLPGVIIENKRYSIAIHYRLSRNKREARRAIHRAIVRLGPVRVIGGKQVVNVLPEGAPHKGLALERLRTRLGCDTALFLGDDQTDEDVFGLDAPGRLLSIRVGRKRNSRATYFIRNQAEATRLLNALASYRNGNESRRKNG